ncbi:hypothetical protein H6G33_32965 [Calothrix sp. FACHB-1219]|uniref:hypothetical protein n=1 Tax=unclassified Calothrix TaxID=2619626 RepID=UPI0019B76F33|nr:hypothetical protein [Calothrix sp. FACHB-1219]MBD2207114.1 hypothetical protein [Calothrix sp. FACHB-168]MBD2221771.1 hypothetical protein [Calothrix sp. FACHB-1219]
MLKTVKQEPHHHLTHRTSHRFGIIPALQFAIAFFIPIILFLKRSHLFKIR